MNYEQNRENVQLAAAWLNKMGYDAWLTATRERSDPAVKAIFGSVVVGNGVYMVTKNGKAYLVANAIDVQEGRESGVFDECRVYSGNFDEVAHALFAETLSGGTAESPKLICLNYSADLPFADGMKLGLWKKLMKLLPDGCDFRTSAQLYNRLNLQKKRRMRK